MDYIGVENFKIFKDKHDFQLYPLTLLIGPNNSGKSSIIKLLLLLKNGLNRLDFKSGAHNLQDFEKSLNWDSDNENIVITLKYHNDLFPAGKYYTQLVYDRFGLSCIRILFNDKTLLEVSSPDFSVRPNELISARSNIINREDHSIDYNAKLDLSFFIDMMLTKQVMVDYYIEVNGEKYKKYESISQYQKNYKEHDLKWYRLKNLDKAIEDYKKGNSPKYKRDLDNNISQDSRKPEHPLGFRNKALLNEINLLKNKRNLFDLYINGENRTTEYYDKIISIENEIFNENLDFCLHLDANIGFLNNLKSLIEFFIEGIEVYIESEFEREDLSNISLRRTELFNLLFEYKSFDLSVDNPYSYKHYATSFIDRLHYFSQDIENDFEDIYHLSARRGSQKRVLLNQSSTDIDEIISEYYDNFIIKNNAFYLNDYYQQVFKLTHKYLREAFNLFDIEGELVVENFENTAYVLSIQNKYKKTNIADLGFGFSQLIPIMLKIINLYKKYCSVMENGINSGAFNVTLIIEEPEANLHPKFQSKLADFFALTLKTFSDIRFVIETHSEYLIRRLQFLTAKKDIGPEKIMIHYFNENKHVTKQEPKIKYISITKNGNLTETFGPGFYDESTQLQFELLKLNEEQNN